ncbi:MAG: hypothetical protein FJZ98_02815 [Chloroflexi bacterium]|nr:hypothetical protein [Chloroflexota bacterium]
MVTKTELWKYLPIATFAIVMVFVSACGGTPAIVDEITPICYGGQFYPEELLLKGEDFFSKYGLNVEHALFSSGADNNQALISGAIDINIGSDIRTVMLFDEMGNNAVIIAVSESGDRYSTMVNPDSEITSWYDMVGEKVGIRMGSGAEQVVQAYFESVGDLQWEDFEWVNLRLEDMPEALTSGVIVSFTAWEPIPSLAETTNGAVVMMSYGDFTQSPVFIHTTRSYAANHKNELTAFLRGHLDKVVMIKNDVNRAARIVVEAAIKEGLDLPFGVVKSVFSRIDFSLDVNEQVLDSLNNKAEYLLKIGEIEEIPEFFVDTSFLEAAKLLNQN